ncbi:MAG: response regulator [Silvanigrellaceae bacterium]
MSRVRQSWNAAWRIIKAPSFLPPLLLIASVAAFIMFMMDLQNRYDVQSQLSRMKEIGKELITLDEWEAVPFNCKTGLSKLQTCDSMQANPTSISLPRTTHFFPELADKFKKTPNQGPNAARLTYRIKLNEEDWIKSHKEEGGALYISVVVPRTTQDELLVYADPENKTFHAGLGINAVTTFPIDEILRTKRITLEYNGYRYRSYGPTVLPVALILPNRTTAYVGLIQKLADSSIPLTLVSLTFPVLAAALAVILDGSRIMFHISGFAFLEAFKALISLTLNTVDGKNFHLLGFQIMESTAKELLTLLTVAALVWLTRVVAEIVTEPSSRLANRKTRNMFAFICGGMLLSSLIPLWRNKSLLYTRLDSVSDIIIAGFTVVLAAYSLRSHLLKRKNVKETQLVELDAKTALFNPTHFFTLRTCLVATSVVLAAFASARDLFEFRVGKIYDPLDWRQAQLVPVLLLSAMLGVGSVTQKISEYARMMRRRVEQLMVGSRTLASSREHAMAISAAVQILERELDVIRSAAIEIILPSAEPRKMLKFKFKLSDSVLEKLPDAEMTDGVAPLPDEHEIISITGNIITLNLFQEMRWLGIISLECSETLYLTSEELHFIQVTQQTLCLTLDNLSAVAELRKADKLKDDFLANTSHELRTPLHGIVGLAETLVSGAEGNISSKVRENLNLIALSGRRLTNLVNDLLDFSQIKQRELKLRLSNVELRPMVQILFSLNETLLGTKRIELHNNVEPNLPLLEADESRLQQILQNLIGNAIKFTHEGHIGVSAVIEGKQLRISVKDTGIGIEQSKRQRIFNSFEQADGHINRAYGGTGLGLTITKQLIELHGGNIRVESEPGVGSEFSFTIPICIDSLKNLDQFSQPGMPQTTPITRPRMLDSKSTWWEVGKEEQNGRSGGMVEAKFHSERGAYKVLVVDDELVNRKVLQNQLQNEDYQIIIAEDGHAALEAMANFKPDLVLLDLMMPRMSGLEVLAEIRKKHQVAELPVIILTAKNQINDLITCFGKGANDFLMKPFSQAELLARMRNHLQISKIHGAYSRFIPQDLLDLLGRESIIDVRLGDQVLREMSVMFLDIRQFSKISETLSPKENFDFLNSYFATVNPIIQQHCGFIDKYIGDAVMALFPNRPDDALLAAVELQRELENFNNSRKTTFRSPINIGLGVHHGPLMLGTLGNEHRMEGTVISDSVNLASRLEGITKIFSVGLVTSQDSIILTQNPRQFDFRSLGKVRPQGFSRALNIVEIFNADHPHVREMKLKTLERHENTMRAFHAGHWDVAIEGWKKNLDENPADKVAALYLDRAVRMKQNPPAEGEWDGVFDMRSR